MPSGPREPRERVTSLRGRVAWTAALSTIAGGAIVAVVSALLGGILVRDQEDRRLRGVIETLRFEVVHEGPRGPSADAASDALVGRIADDEQAEVLETGVRVAVYRGARRLGGGAVSERFGDGCSTRGSGASRQCVSRVSMPRGADLTLVAESSLAPLARFERWWAAAAVTALLGLALVAAWASRRIATRAIAPLEKLRRTIASIDPVRPDPAVVSGPIPSREIDEIRAEFQGLLERVAASLAQSERFAANVAHEWRTPLAALRAEVELLCEGPDAAPVREPLRRVERHIRALSERLDRVLVLARPDASTLHLPESGEPVSLESTIREVVAGFDAERRGRIVVDASADEEGLVRGDATLLEMMFRNAVENALVHGGPGRVAITLARDGDHFVSSVRDQGPGLAAEDRERVFEPFFRTARARTEGSEGMGLGLALVRHIARLHGGDARFEAATQGALLRIEVRALANER